MADNIANIPSSVADSTPQETLASSHTSGSGTLVMSGASKPSYWPSTPYRVTVFDSTNGDVTYRVSAESWPTLTVSVVEGSDHTFAAGSQVEHLGPLTAGGFDDRADSRASTLIATHEADTAGPHGVTDFTKQVPVKIFQPGARTTVQAATTANITLSGTQTVDTVALIAGDKCLVKDQATASENGVYTVAAGAWTRHADADTADEVYRGIVMVLNGSVNTNKLFASSNLTPPTIGADSISYVEINDSLSVPDSTAANRMALDLVSFLFGDHDVSGTWSFGAVSALNVTDLSAVNASFNDGTVALYCSTADGDSVAGMSVVDDASGSGVFVSGTGKIASSADVVLELKSGLGTTTNQNWIYLNGGRRDKTVTKTANYTVDVGDRVIAYTTLAASRTVTLPAISAVAAGWRILILDSTTGTHADTNNLIIQRAGTDLFVGGGTSTTINTANGWREIICINSRWQVISSG